ncbi:MAG: AsmA-like C-terminal region-containing protein, partial [Kiritimatiellae bacterium]|nr:AsmA-like C-terminal region-containing protein [Kiritimatiellia bacterium]
ENIAGELVYSQSGLTFTYLNGTLCNMPFSASGFFALPDDMNPEKTIYEQWMSHFVKNLDGPMPEWVQGITEELNACSFTGSGRLEATFRLDPVRLNGNIISLHAGGGEALVRGITLTNWVLSGELTNGVASVTNARFHSASGSCSVLLEDDFANDRLEASAGSTMTMNENLALLPLAWQNFLKDAGFRFEGTSDAGIHVQPAPMDQFTENVIGRIRTDTVLYKDIPLRNICLTFEWDKDVAWLNGCKATIDGGPHGQGTLQTDGMLYLNNNSFVNHFDLSFQPQILLPLIPDSADAFIQSFEFSGPMPEVKGTLSGQLADLKSIRFKGHTRMQDFAWQGAPLSSFNADILVTNNFIQLSGIQAVRQEGDMTGEITMPLDKDTVEFNIASQMNPKIMAEMIHPAVVSILEPFEFRGPTDVLARGAIDYSVRTQMNFQVEVQATNISIYSLDFDDCSLTVSGTGDEYRVENFNGRLCGGSAVGSMVFFPITTNDDYRYNLDAAFTNLSLDAIMRQIGSSTNDPSDAAKQGHATGHVLLSGLTETNWLNSLVAKGHITIDEGMLLSIRLFGPLSLWLSRVVPNLGYLTQTEFESDFTIQDGHLQMDNARMYGTVISIAIRGQYGLADQSLDFRVQVKFLRKSLFAKLVNLVTYPITKLLLEFQVGGTLENPDWRPVNLPKELYFNFH